MFGMMIISMCALAEHAKLACRYIAQVACNMRRAGGV